MLDDYEVANGFDHVERLHTEMRRAKVGLKWGDVDLRRATVRIRRAQVEIYDPTAPKGHRNRIELAETKDEDEPSLDSNRPEGGRSVEGASYGARCRSYANRPWVYCSRRCHPPPVHFDSTPMPTAT